MDRTSTNNERKIPVKGDDLTKINIYSYGIGHFMNDLCASCWFFFLSYYLKDIIKIGEYNAGYVMLAGQLADALATPTVGILSDKTNTRLGKRTPWYIGGTILVFITFTLIFLKVIPEDSNQTVTLIYYCSCAALFNIGWAAVQVSHMALLPQLSLNKRNKDRMNRIRTGFTFLAQTATLCLSFLFFWLIKDKIVQYEVLAISCVILGLFTSFIFLFLCKEIVLSKNIPQYLEIMRTSLQAYLSNSNTANEPLIVLTNSQLPNESANGGTQINNTDSSKAKNFSWTCWLKKPDFYVYMLVYMFVRLSINVTQSVIPFYMEYVLNFKKTADGGTRVEISIVLLISTIGSILNSLFIQSTIEKKLKRSSNSRLIMISISSLFVIIGCVPMFFLNSEFRYPMYGLAFFFGIGFSQGLSTVSNLINDVVGSKGSQGAFVYGAYSFADKLSCGIVLVFFLPIADNVDVLKYSMPIFPPLSLILAFFIVLIRGIIKSKNEKRESKCDRLDSDQNDAKKIAEHKKSIIDNSRFTFISNHNTKLKYAENEGDTEQV